MRINKTLTKTVEQKELDAIKCDRCGKTYECNPLDEIGFISDTPTQPDRIASTFEFQEFLCLRRTGGYASVFGDMDTWTLDLCQTCQKELFGEFIKYEEPADQFNSTWWEEE